MAAPIAWDFEPRNVTFQLTIKATFQPALGNASISIPWLDASGQLSTTASSGPLKELEVQTGNAGAGGRCPPGAIRVEQTKDIGTFPVTMELVRGLQRGVLPISMHVPAPGAPAEADPKAKGKKGGEEEASAVQAPGSARIHLGPLLLANNFPSGEGDEEGAPAAPNQPPRAVRSSEVGSSWTESIGIAGLYRVELKISTPEPVLSRPMLQRLMPACFTVQAVRGLPNELWISQKCEEVYVEVYPKMSSVTACLAQEFPRTRSGSAAQHTMVRFNEPIVWLLGLAPPHVVREWLMHEGLLVEVHDRDLKPPPPQPKPEDGDEQAAGQAPPEDAGEPVDAQVALMTTLDRLGHDGVRKEHPHGVAHFTFTTLLESTALQVALRSDVLPSRSDKKVRRAEMMAVPLKAKGLLEPEGIQNMENRARVDKREDTTRFSADHAVRANHKKPHHAGTVCTIKAELAVPIPSLADIESSDKGKKHEDWASIEQRQGDSNVYAAVRPERPASAFRAKVPLPSAEVAEGPWRLRQDDAEADARRLQEALGDAEDADAAKAAAEELMSLGASDFSHRFERYGRLVIILRENETRSIQAVLQAVKDWNGKTLGMDPNGAELATYVLSEEERRDDKPLDVLTGFLVMDGVHRIMVVEGLRDSGLLEVLKAVPRDARPNDHEFKLLHHPGIGFGKRLYADFGPKLKQIKIRMPLDKLAAKPELYSMMGTEANDTVAGLNAPKLLKDLKNIENLKSLRQGANFPKATHLTNLEILFGGYVTDEELAGRPSPRRSSVKKMIKNVGITAHMSNIMRAEAEAASVGTGSPKVGDTLKEADRMASTARKKSALDMTNTNYLASLTLRKTQSMPDFRRTNIEAVRQQSEAVEKLNDLMGKKRERQTPFLDGQEVYLYSTQKLNSAELQKDWMRKHIDSQAKDKMWTYCPAYSSGNFEFSGAQPPGIKSHTSSVPNDSFANLPGDDRDPFRMVQSRAAESFKKLDRDVDDFRKEQIREPFVEGEWHKWRGREEHQKSSISHEVRFEPDKVPHHRIVAQRPFDQAKMTVKGQDFGPRCLFESVHYHGRRPGEDRSEEAEHHNTKLFDAAESKILHHKNMRAYTQGSTRHGVTDLDRCEATLKGEPHRKLGQTIQMPAATIRVHEEYHNEGRPDKEWHARLRENDSTPPFDVTTGTYLRRDPEVGTGMKRAVTNGTIGKAPWRHMTGTEPETTKKMEYPCPHDFNLTRKPPKSKQCENQLWKNASRTSITQHERTDHRAYKRPHHFGVSLSQT